MDGGGADFLVREERRLAGAGKKSAKPPLRDGAA
jgi:hypothetical protein